MNDKDKLKNELMNIHLDYTYKNRDYIFMYESKINELIRMINKENNNDELKTGQELGEFLKNLSQQAEHLLNKLK